jgi:hypothetical protein
VTSDCRQRAFRHASPISARTALASSVQRTESAIVALTRVPSTAGRAAADQFVAQRLLAGLHRRNLGFDAAELVGNIAGPEIVEWGYRRDSRNSLGHRVTPLLGVRPGGVLHHPVRPLVISHTFSYTVANCQTTLCEN